MKFIFIIYLFSVIVLYNKIAINWVKIEKNAVKNIDFFLVKLYNKN